MRRNNVAGLIFSNMHDEQMRELTAVRTMASVPFGIVLHVFPAADIGTILL